MTVDSPETADAHSADAQPSDSHPVSKHRPTVDTELHPTTGLVFDRVGSGPPTVLIHGLGSSRTIWTPVIETLARQRDLILVDMPGFGETPALPTGVEPSAPYIAELVISLLDDLGLGRPHVVGHSFGGWVALEVAARGRASSVTAVAPAGLWNKSMPPVTRATLRTLRLLSQRLGPLAPALVHSPIARAALLWPQSGRPWAVRPEDILRELDGYASCAGFEPTLRSTIGRRFEGKAALDVPVTVVTGSRDLVIDRWQAQERDLLPASARWVELRGSGHVPQWDDKDTLTRLLLDGSSAPLRPARHPRAGRSR